MCLGHADRHLVESESCKSFDFFLSSRCELDAVSAVNLSCDCVDLFFDGHVFIIAECEVVRLFAKFYNFLSQSYAAYEGNEEFKAAMEAEFNSCVKEKVADAAKEAANEGIKNLANKLGK